MDDLEILLKRFEEAFWAWKERLTKGQMAEYDAREAERISDQMKLLLGDRFYELSSVCRKLREIQRYLDSQEIDDDWSPKSKSVEEELGL